MGSLRKGIDVDPTRSIKSSKATAMHIVMHHYSYVRKDISRKIKNSTARKNIERSNILSDYLTAKEGNVLKDKNKKLILVKNKFLINV